jgi:hypothetical protein
MRTLKVLTIALTTSALIWSCQNNNTDSAYAEVTATTDSIQTMNAMLMDTLNMVVMMNEEAKSSMDSANVDSTMMASLAANQVVLDEQKATLGMVSEMVSSFQSAVATNDSTDVAAADATAKVEEIKSQQSEVFNTLATVKSELSRIGGELKNMKAAKAASTEEVTPAEDMTAKK